MLNSHLSRIGRIENPSCSACGFPTQDTSYLTLSHLSSHSYLTSVTDFLKFLAAFCLYTTPDTDSAQFSDLWSSMVFFHAPISHKGFDNNNNNNNKRNHFERPGNPSCISATLVTSLPSSTKNLTMATFLTQNLFTYLLDLQFWKKN